LWRVVAWANNLALARCTYFFSSALKRSCAASISRRSMHEHTLAFRGYIPHRVCAAVRRYAGTGRSIVLSAENLLELYKNYANSHYHRFTAHPLSSSYIACFSTERFGATFPKVVCRFGCDLFGLIAPALFTPHFVMTDRNRHAQTRDKYGYNSNGYLCG